MLGIRTQALASPRNKFPDPLVEWVIRAAGPLAASV